MKICMLTERMRTGFGVDVVVHEQARRLVRRGHDVTVLVVHADFVQPAREYKLFVIDSLAFRPDYSNEHAMRQMLRRCNVEDADVWVIHTAPFYEWIHWLDAPIIAVEYGTPPASFFEPAIAASIEAYVRHRFDDLFSKLQSFDRIISISKDINAWLPRALRRISTVIHLGADHYEKISPQERDDFRRMLGFGAGPLALWVGRMQLSVDDQPYKGFADVLKIAPAVESSVPGSTFLLAGRISDGDAFELKERGFKVAANLSSRELSLTFAAVDVLVNVSRWEGFNLALVEAQYQGTPVIAYNFGPHREVVSDGKSGLLLSDRDGVIRSTVAILRDRKLRSQLSAKAVEFAQAFSWEAHVDRLVNVFTQCIDAAPPRPGIAQARRDASPKAAHAGGGTLAAGKPSRLVRFGRDVPLRSISPRRSLNHDLDGRSSKLSNEAFVAEAFRILLGREAEPDAILGFSQQLAKGRSRLSLAAEIRFSSEGVGRPVDDADLVAALDRETLAHCARDSAAMSANLRLSMAALTEAVQRQESRSGSDWNGLAERLMAIEEHLTRLHRDIANLRSSDESDTELEHVRGPEGYVALVAIGAQVCRSAAQTLSEVLTRKSGDIVYGDEIETRPDDPPRLVVKGPIGQDLTPEHLGDCVYARKDLLAHLGIRQSSVLTRELAGELLTSAAACTYVPVVLSQKSSAAVHEEPKLAAAIGGPVSRHLPQPALSTLALVLVAVEDPSSIATSEGFERLKESCGAVFLIAPRSGGTREQAGRPGLGGRIVEVDDGAGQIEALNQCLDSLPADVTTVALVDQSYWTAIADVLAPLMVLAEDPEVGIACPRAVDIAGRTVHAGLFVSGDRSLDYICRYGGETQSVRYDLLQERRQITAAALGCWLFRRDLVDIVGRFDAALEAAASYVEFCLRVRSYSFSVVVEGRCCVIANECNPIWTLNLSAADALKLKMRYASVLSTSDSFWIERTSRGQPRTIRPITSECALRPAN